MNWWFLGFLVLLCAGVFAVAFLLGMAADWAIERLRRHYGMPEDEA